MSMAIFGEGRVHPHACGRTSPAEPAGPTIPGPSPRVQGNLILKRSAAIDRGSIPARAGEPPTSSRDCPRVQVHPRACGGADWPEELTMTPSGPSPRVQGNRPGVARSLGADGSIPARAGEPGRWPTCVMWMTVHPRACGGTPVPAWAKKKRFP